MKLFLIKRKLLSLGLCLLCSAVMFYLVSHPAVIGTAATVRQLPIYCVQRDQKVIALSFDAAWGDVRVRYLRSSHATTAHSPEWAVVQSVKELLLSTNENRSFGVYSKKMFNDV